MPGRILDVVARRLHQARRLAQLGQHAPRPLRDRRVREERLAGEARGQRVGIQLRVSFPRSDLFELDHPRPDGVGQHRALDPLGGRQQARVDLVETAQKARERPRLGLDGRTAQIFEQVVKRVHAVQRGAAGMGLVEVTEIVVDEVGKGFG